MDYMKQCNEPKSNSPRILGCNFFVYNWKLPAYSGFVYLQLWLGAFFTLTSYKIHSEYLTFTFGDLCGPVIRNATRGDSRGSIRRKTPSYFMTCERFAQIASNLRFASFLAPRSAIRKKRVRENQAIRTNLRIDSRESGHLSLGRERLLLGK